MSFHFTAKYNLITEKLEETNESTFENEIKCELMEHDKTVEREQSTNQLEPELPVINTDFLNDFFK